MIPLSAEWFGRAGQWHYSGVWVIMLSILQTSGCAYPWFAGDQWLCETECGVELREWRSTKTMFIHARSMDIGSSALHTAWLEMSRAHDTLRSVYDMWASALYGGDYRQSGGTRSLPRHCVQCAAHPYTHQQEAV